jgi:hypothetical protein
VSHASLGLVDARIIGVMFQTDPQLTFRDDIKTSIFDIRRMTPLSMCSLNESVRSMLRPISFGTLMDQQFKLPSRMEKRQKPTLKSCPRMWSLLMSMEITPFSPNVSLYLLVEVQL